MSTAHERAGRAVPAADVVVAGHTCLDIKPQLDGCRQDAGLAIPGGLVIVGPPAIAPGGAVGNTGLALHELGVKTRLMGCVADDPLGRLTRDLLRARGRRLASDMLVLAEGVSSYCIVVEPRGADRSFLAHPGVNDAFCAGDIPYRRLKGARLFHFGYPTLMRRMLADGGRPLADMFAKVKKAGLATSLDMSTPDPNSEQGRIDWRGLLEKVLPHVDVFLPSLPELLFMLDRPRFERLRKKVGSPEVTPLADGKLLRRLTGELLEMGCAVAGLKLGDRGLCMQTAGADRIRAMGGPLPIQPEEWAGREVYAPAFDVVSAGTTGAGDYAIAGFLCALLRGLGPLQALEAAAAAGAWRVEGTAAPMRWTALARRVRAGWPRRPDRSSLAGKTDG